MAAVAAPFEMCRVGRLILSNLLFLLEIPDFDVSSKIPEPSQRYKIALEKIGFFKKRKQRLNQKQLTWGLKKQRFFGVGPNSKIGSHFKLNIDALAGMKPNTTQN